MKRLKTFLVSPACLSFLFGVIAVFAFAPFRLCPLVIVSLAGLLWVFIHSSPKEAFRRGFYYGLGFFGAGVYWVYISLRAFGDAPMVFSLLMTAGFIAVLAIFPAAVGGCMNRHFPVNTSVKLWLVFPAIWTFSEWVRSWVFSGFPWLLAGSSQTILPFSGLAAVAGVYMVSFILAHIAGVIIYLSYATTIQRRNTLVYLVSLLTGCTVLSVHHWTHPTGASFSVSLVQGNITPSLKWQEGAAENTYQHYLQLSQNQWENRLVIWPEAAIPMSLPGAGDKLDEIKKISQEHHAGFITGIPYQTADFAGDYNAAVAVGEAQGTYFKRHLVPFGEYFPISTISKPLLNWLEIPMSDFKAGARTQQVMSYQHTLISTFICYEVIFPEEVRQSLSKAGVILILSDDAWFGHSLAQAQHVQMAQMRAIETGRYVLSVTNNGITAIINPQGEIVKALPPYQSGVLSGEIMHYSGETPWMRFGSNIYLLICIFSLMIGRITAKRLPILIARNLYATKHR
jgi:apolipoprotein N-acyltransferase